MNPVPPEALAAAEVVWAYHLMHHRVTSSDCLVVFGSNDLRVADYAAELYHQGVAPLVVVAGGLGNFTRGLWQEPEAVAFAARMRALGVPGERILVEPESSNTAENVVFTRKVLAAYGQEVRSVTAVHKPFMERRTFGTIRRLWPEVELAVTSPPIPLADYPNAALPLDHVINAAVGDLQRIVEYSRTGWQAPETVPSEVMAAYRTLVGLGFTDHLLAL